MIDSEFHESMNRTLVGAQAAKAFEWPRWADEIPYLSFPEHWLVQVLYPFGGAVIRFRVRTGLLDGGSSQSVSVYFDGYDNLGCMFRPYWEIYPNVYDQNARFLVGEEADMFREIHKALSAMEAGIFPLPSPDLDKESSL